MESKKYTCNRRVGHFVSFVQVHSLISSSYCPEEHWSLSFGSEPLSGTDLPFCRLYMNSADLVYGHNAKSIGTFSVCPGTVSNKSKEKSLSALSLSAVFPHVCYQSKQTNQILCTMWSVFFRYLSKIIKNLYQNSYRSEQKHYGSGSYIESL